MKNKLLKGILFTVLSIVGLVLPTLILIFLKREDWISTGTSTVANTSPTP